MEEKEIFKREQWFFRNIPNVEISLNENGELTYQGSDSAKYEAKLKAEGFSQAKAGIV